MKKQHIDLSEADENQLDELLSKGILRAQVYKRALALLELQGGKTIVEVAALLHISYPTAHGWVKKYRAEGLAFLQDKARSGRPTVYDGLAQAKVVALACSEVPQGRSEWSLRLLADKAVELGLVDHAISHVEVGRILKKRRTNLTSNGSGALDN